MKLFKLLALLLLFFSSPVLARTYYFNYAQKGGARVITSGSQSLTQVQRSFPGCLVSVYATGTTNLIPLFSDNIGTPKSNPFTAGNDASFSFYTNSSNFDIKFSGPGITTGCGAAGQLACISAFTWSGVTGITGGSNFDIRTCAATGNELTVLGNGLSKPLSGFYSSLAAAQVDYPEAAGLTDELDWAVIQKCTTAAANNTLLSNGTYTGAEVAITSGIYIINKQISVNPNTLNQRGSYTNFIGYGNPSIVQTSVGSDILVWQTGVNSGGNYDNKIFGIVFQGGRRQIAFANANNEGAKLSIVDSTFRSSDDYAIYGGQSGSTALNTLLTVERVRFTGCKKVLYTTSSPTKLSNIWGTGGDVLTGLNNTPSNTALIYMATHSKLLLDNFYFSPVLDESLQQRWIDVHGQALYIDRSRFGGELAGGVSVAWWFTSPNLSNGFNDPSPTVFSVTNSDLECGSTNLSGANVGVLNLRTDVPQMMIFRGNRYFFEFAKINNGGGINFATYFAGMPTHYVWKIEHEPDWKWFSDDAIGAGQPPDIPPTLRPFLTDGDVEGGGSAPRSLTLANGLNSNISIQQTYKNLLISGPTGAFSIGGFDNGWQGREIRVMYLGGQTMTLINADASSSAANRIRTNTGGNIAGVHAAIFIYDQTSTTWILISYN